LQSGLLTANSQTGRLFARHSRQSTHSTRHLPGPSAPKQGHWGRMGGFRVATWEAKPLPESHGSGESVCRRKRSLGSVLGALISACTRLATGATGVWTVSWCRRAWKYVRNCDVGVHIPPSLDMYHCMYSRSTRRILVGFHGFLYLILIVRHRGVPA